MVLIALTACAQASTPSLESMRVAPAGADAMASSLPPAADSDAGTARAMPPLMRPDPPTTYYDWYWQWRYLWKGLLPIRYERYPTLRVSADVPTRGLDRLVLGIGDFSDVSRPAADSAEIALVPEASNEEVMGDGIFSVRFMLASGDRVGDEFAVKATLGRSVLKATIPRLSRDMALVFDCVSVENEGIQRPLTVTVSAKGVRPVTSSSMLTLHSSMLAMKRIDAAKEMLSKIDDQISKQRQRGAQVSDYEVASDVMQSSIELAEKRLYERELLQALAELSKTEAKLDALARQVR